jgi:hypothetical protein
VSVLHFGSDAKDDGNGEKGFEQQGDEKAGHKFEPEGSFSQQG